MRARLAHLLVGASFAFTLLLAASAGTASACDCAIGAPDDNLARADLAFDGTVATVAVPPSVPGRDTSLDPILVTFSVETILKWTPGGPADQVTISTANNSAACGVAFAPGERWRVYATVVPGGNPQTGSCSGDVLLGQGTVPAPPDAGPPLQFLAVIGIVLLLVAFSAWAFTRRPGGASA